MKKLFWLGLISLGTYGFISLLDAVGALTGIN